MTTAETTAHISPETGRPLHFPTGRPLAEALGYPADLLDWLPPEAVDSFAGVGYHLGLVRLVHGERVLDLGSGSGTDVFSAALQVGPRGHVAGVDTSIEDLPFEDGSFDAVISNGVVNLSADKRAVFAEAARVLRPGGRLALSDIVTERRIATRTAAQADLWAACIAGASRIDLYVDDIAAAGLELEVLQRNPGYRFASERARRTSDKYGAHSISLLARKPSRAAAIAEVSK